MNDSIVARAERPPAVFACLETLTKRAQFLACTRARKQPCPAFLLQARQRPGDDPHIGIGFTASKKVGNAVARNRAKRRLRALARAILPSFGQPGWDYVLVARRDETALRSMVEMEKDLKRALSKVHGARSPS